MKDLSLIQLIKEQIRAENEKAAHATPTMLYGTVTSVAGNGLVSVQLDGVASPSADLETLSPVTVGDRVMLHLQHRHLVVVGSIQRTDKLDADTLGGQSSGHFMQYLPGHDPNASPIAGFDANTVERWRASLIPIYNGVNTPSKAIAVLETIPYSNGWVAQYFHEMSGDNKKLYRRTYHSGTTWSAWEQQFATSDANPNYLRETYFYTTDSTLTVGGVVEAMYPTLPNGLSAVDVNRAGSRMAVIVNKTSALYGTAITTNYTAYNTMYYSVLRNGSWQHSRVNMTLV